MLIIILFAWAVLTLKSLNKVEISFNSHQIQYHCSSKLSPKRNKECGHQGDGISSGFQNILNFRRLPFVGGNKLFIDSYIDLIDVFWGCFLRMFSEDVFWGCFLGMFSDNYQHINFLFVIIII